MPTPVPSERYRLVRVLLSEARARRIAGKFGFWFLMGAANRARRRATTPAEPPMQADLFNRAQESPR